MRNVLLLVLRMCVAVCSFVVALYYANDGQTIICVVWFVCAVVWTLLAADSLKAVKLQKIRDRGEL